MPISTDELKKRYALLPETIETVDQYIQHITTSAYKNVRLLSNQLLSRNPHSTEFFKRFLFEQPPRAWAWLTIPCLVARYYLMSFGRFALYTLTYFSEALAGRRKITAFPQSERPLYLMDSFLLIDRVLQEGTYRDEYLGALISTLKRESKEIVLVPRLYGRLTPGRMKILYKRLEESGHAFATEFQLLRLSDLLRMVKFILLYPFDVIRLAIQIPKESSMDVLFTSELIHTLSLINLEDFVRYLVGKRSGEKHPLKLVVLSWNENQTIDKNFYKGIKRSAPTCIILGCQFFIACPALLTDKIAASEISTGVTPDVVLVNGPAYVRVDAPVPYRKGVSIRYPGLFAKTIFWPSKIKTSLFLSFYPGLNKDIVSLTSLVPSLHREPLEVRAHPAAAKHLPELPASWSYSTKDRYQLIAESAIVITADSSVAVEAAALGTSVIIVASQNTFSLNPMLPLGEGEIWNIAFSAEELSVIHEHLLTFRGQKPDRIAQLAAEYKTQCFIEPTEENIIHALDLRA